jgi:hypothetical protein
VAKIEEKLQIRNNETDADLKSVLSSHYKIDDSSDGGGELGWSFLFIAELL